MNTSTIQKALIRQAIYYKHPLVAKNIYLYEGWECDLISVTYSDIITEYEIKRSRADYLADFQKKDKHFSTKNGYGANYFYYACPIGLIKKSEVPEYAGLIYCNGKGSYVSKKAPILHNEKMSYNQLKKLAIKIMSSKYI